MSLPVSTVVLVCSGCRDKVTQTRGLRRQNFVFLGPGGQESEIDVVAELVSSEASLLGSQMAVFSLGLHVVFSLPVSVS